MAETKYDKFLRLSKARTDKILEQLEILGNLANKNNYDYDPEDKNEIIKKLKKGINDLDKKFDVEQRKWEHKKAKELLEGK